MFKTYIPRYVFIIQTRFISIYCCLKPRGHTAHDNDTQRYQKNRSANTFMLAVTLLRYVPV